MPPRHPTILLLLCSVIANAQEHELTPEGVHFFEAKIRHVLVEQCFQCHSAEEKIRGGLVLDSREGMRRGGDSGEAIIPGDPEASLLWRAIGGQDPDYQMPPKKFLSDAVVEDFRQWIAMGAPDPRIADPGEMVTSEIDVDAGRGFWSFQLPKRTAPPKVKEEKWPHTDVDRFILTKLEDQNLSPAADAAPEVLLRRLSIDLVGLIPTPQDVEAFRAAWNVDPKRAYDERVESLLESDQFGERWGRHWLDVARYAESSGKEINVAFPQAWRYRDYVIDAFNQDKPYDEFIQEQIAGDLLAVENDEEWQEHLIATGFLALGLKGLNERNARQFAADLADDQIDVISQTVLGLTVSCARCHDHKSDPIPTTDYYALAGIFQNTQTFYGTTNQGTTRRGSNLLELPVRDRVPLETYSQAEISELHRRLGKAEEDLRGLVREQAQERLSARRQRTAPKDSAEKRREFVRLQGLTATLRAKVGSIDENGTAKALAMGVQDRRPVSTDATVFIRGDVDRPGSPVERGFLQVLPHTARAQAPSTKQSGRLELAWWLTSPENPLTARVYVNRVWQHLFGAGLVASPNDFGTSGQAPSHAELLDHLAISFMEDGWSTKSLIRDLVHSRTYRMSARFDAANHERDPDNVLHWRHAPRRMDAESLRDSLLLVSGQLDLERPLGSPVAKASEGGFGGRIRPEMSEVDATYRSIYLPMVRDAAPESLALFDVADANLVTGIRESTNVPGQALYMMNNPFVIAQSQAFAQRLIQEPGPPRERVTRGYQLAYGRDPSSEELDSSILFLNEFHQSTQQKSSKNQRKGLGAWRMALESFCQSLLASAEFRYIN